MPYLPLKVVTLDRQRLEEHYDLTKPLSFFQKTQSYLVVAQGKHYQSLDLSKILVFHPQLSLSSAVSSLTPLLTDQFIARYIVSFLPLVNPFLDPRSIRVFDPSTTRKHTVHFSSTHTPEIVDDPKQKGFLDDLLIVSKEDMSNYLVAVNGVFHPTTYHDGKLWVLDGFRTIRLSGLTDVVVVDTGPVGGHRIVPLTPSVIEETDWAVKALVTLPDPVSHTNIFPVIDGYFHHRDSGVFEKQSDTKAWLHTNKLTLIEQFRHNPRTFLPNGRWTVDENPQSRRYTDAFQSVFGERWSVPTSVLQSRAFQYSRLTSFHSFLVVMNNPHLYTVSDELRPTGANRFFTHQGETYLNGMMRYGCGLCPSYAIWADPEGRQTVFIPRQFDDGDPQGLTFSPTCIPTPEQVASNASATMVNYVSN